MSFAVAQLASSPLNAQTSAPAQVPAAAAAVPAAERQGHRPPSIFGLSLSTRAPYFIRTIPASLPAHTMPSQPTTSASSSCTTSPVSPTPTPTPDSITSATPPAVPANGGDRNEVSSPHRRASVPSSPVATAKEEIWRDGLRTGFLSFSSTL